jgi:hypothetical protein
MIDVQNPVLIASRIYGSGGELSKYRAWTFDIVVKGEASFCPWSPILADEEVDYC